ncbi:MAG: hypothetical protein JXQ75_10865 [Phycisphaerae bacterium]|nr:hypothetical protein [Phycisphaerae bacterium]
MSTPLTEAEVKKLAEDWYKALDVHAPMVDILPMLSPGGLRMVFPEATLNSLAEFEGWYQGVIRIFFDEVHTLKEVTPSITGETASVKIIVKWEASKWNPPAAKSDRLIMDAYQTWQVERAADGSVVVTEYVVDRLEPYPGSAPL